jgi:hypothetical protein
MQIDDDISQGLTIRKKPLEKREIDTRLVVSIGVILRTYARALDSVSLRTIARLTVLILWSAGVIQQETDALTMTYTGRRVSVATVEQKLRRGAPLFRPRP